MSPFFVLASFCFFRLLLLKNFSLASPRNDDSLLGRPTGSLPPAVILHWFRIQRDVRYECDLYEPES